jgi:hypothetical protein
MNFNHLFLLVFDEDSAIEMEVEGDQNHDNHDYNDDDDDDNGDDHDDHDDHDDEMWMNPDDGDEIVRKLDVCVATQLAHHIHLFQFPLRPKKRPYENSNKDLGGIKTRFKPKV